MKELPSFLIALLLVVGGLPRASAALLLFPAASPPTDVFIADSDAEPTNQPPVVSITAPADGSVVYAGPIIVCAEASDPDGEVVSLEYFEGTNSIGTVTNLPISPFPGPGPVPITFAPASGGALSNTLRPQIIVWPIWGMFWNAEPGEYVLTAKATDNDGASTTSAPVHVTVVSLPTVTIRATDAIAWEPGPSSLAVPGVFTVARSGSTNFDLQVFYEISGSAVNGTNYETIPGSVAIPAGQDSAQIAIVPLHDGPLWRTQSVKLKLSTGVYVIPLVEAWPPYYNIGRPSQATVFIRNERLRPVHAPSVTVESPYKGQSFPLGAAITILADASDPDSYVTKVEFFDGLKPIGEIPCPLPVPPPGTPVSFSLTWSNAPAGRHLLSARATNSGGARRVSSAVGIEVVK